MKGHGVENKLHCVEFFFRFFSVGKFSSFFFIFEIIIIITTLIILMMIIIEGWFLSFSFFYFPENLHSLF